MTGFGRSLRPMLIAALASVAAGACATAPVVLPTATPTPAIFGRTTAVAFQPVQALECCALEYPSDSWTMTGGQEPGLVTLSQEQGQARVVLERSELSVRLAPEEINDVFAAIEMDIIREQHPDASGFDSVIVDEAAIPIVVTHYRRPGAGAPQKIRQYSFARGTELYRLICTAAESNFLVYEQIFAHIAASFRAGAES